MYCFGFFDAVGFEVDRFDAERAPREEDDPVRDFEECWPDVRPFDVDLEEPLEEPLEERLDELFDAPLEELDPVVRFDRPSWDERDDGFRFGCCATWGPFGAAGPASLPRPSDCPQGGCGTYDDGMSRFSSKAELLTDARTALDRLEALLDRIPPEAKVTGDVVDGLTVKDILAHRTEWGRMALGWYDTARTGAAHRPCRPRATRGGSCPI